MLNLLKTKTVFISKENHKLKRGIFEDSDYRLPATKQPVFYLSTKTAFKKSRFFLYPENDPNGLYRTQKIKIGTKNLEIRCQYTTKSWAFKIESNDETAPEQHHNRHDMSGL